jgi:hypothetical protein
MIEEQGLADEQGLGIVLRCADVPEWARITDVLPMFVSGERRATVRFTRAHMREGMGRREWEEVIEW